MPEWLLKAENYQAQADRDTFIEKSILALLSVLARIRRQGGSKSHQVALNPALKMAVAFILIVLLSLSRSFTFVVIVNVYMIALLSMMEAEAIIKILKVSAVMAVFTFVILIPALLMGNTYSSMMLTAKVLATVMAVNMLSHSTKWHDLTNALKTFYVPDMFILVLDITIKYIVLLGDFSLNMLYALKLRSVGRNKSKYTSLSGIAGTLFIKSKEMAEEMYAAMECRGFTGEYKVNRKFKFAWADALFAVFNSSFMFLYFYLGRV